MGVVPLTIIPSDPLARFLFPVPVTLCPVGLEVLVPQGEMLPPGDKTMVPLNWKLRLSPSYIGQPMPLNQQTKKGVLTLARVTDSDYEGEIGLLLHSGGKEEYV